jgi:hypothetical protein
LAASRSPPRSPPASSSSPRLDPAGVPRWAAALGGRDDRSPRIAAAVDNAGELVLAGAFTAPSRSATPRTSARAASTSSSPASTPLAPACGARASATPTIRRAPTSPSTRAASPSSPAPSSARSTSAATPLIAPPGAGTRLLARLDVDGSHLWSRDLGGDGATPVRGQRHLGIDDAGAIYLATDFLGTIDLGDGPLTSKAVDLLVAKLAPDGAVLWSKLLGGTASHYSYGLALNPAGELALTGRGDGPIDFGGGPIASVNYGFVARLGPDGEHRWSLAIPRPDFTSATHVETLAVADDGSVLVGGAYSGALVFGGPSLVTPQHRGEPPLRRPARRPLSDLGRARRSRPLASRAAEAEPEGHTSGHERDEPDERPHEGFEGTWGCFWAPARRSSTVGDGSAASSASEPGHRR